MTPTQYIRTLAAKFETAKKARDTYRESLNPNFLGVFTETENAECQRLADKAAAAMSDWHLAGWVATRPRVCASWDREAAVFAIGASA